MTDTLDDYLGLLTQPLRALQLILFHGESGSGKSSQIRLLIEQHHDFRGRDFHIVAPGESLPMQCDVLVIEELRVWADTQMLRPALHCARQVLVASHLPLWTLWSWRIGRRHCAFSLDRHPHKLARWLRQRNHRFSSIALADFQNRYGANYTDLDIVLRGTDGETRDKDFDAAYARFRRGGHIRRD